MHTTQVQLAHNIVRLTNFDTEGRPLWNNYVAQLSPVTVRATERFVRYMCAALAAPDPHTIEALGPIFSVTTRSLLNAIAYDVTFDPNTFVQQFVFSYVPSLPQQCVFLGAHLARIKSAIKHGAPLHANLTLPNLAVILRQVILHEVMMIYDSFVAAAKDVENIENIDPSVLAARRVDRIIITI